MGHKWDEWDISGTQMGRVEHEWDMLDKSGIMSGISGTCGT